LLGIPISEEAKAIGLAAEQPCRLEKVPEANLEHILEGASKDFKVYLDVCHNP
jgi:hypothetical protein